ncbi:MAG: NUDIX hydrolase [Sulfitobacter sp.]
MKNIEFQSESYLGAKLALYIGGKLAVILRDDFAGLPYAGCWDFPGGGREGDETPLACALRECAEELGIAVPPSAIVWRYGFYQGGRDRWFFVAELPQAAAADVVFGDEGQCWRLMPEQEFLAQEKAVDFLQDRLGRWIALRDHARA